MVGVIISKNNVAVGISIIAIVCNDNNCQHLLYCPHFSDYLFDSNDIFHQSVGGLAQVMGDVGLIFDQTI